MPVIPYKTGVYCIVNHANRKRYVGSGAITIIQRIRDHRKRLIAGTHKNKHLQSAWNKYGRHRFTFVILELCHSSQCLAREQYWIDFFKSSDPKYGYNKCKIAGSVLGLKLTDETKKKMSIAHKGYKHSDASKLKISQNRKGKDTPEGRAKIAAAMRRPEVRAKKSKLRKGFRLSPASIAKMAASLRGRKLSEEHKEKIRASSLGRKHTEESKAKMSAAVTGRKLTPEHVAKLRVCGLMGAIARWGTR